MKKLSQFFAASSLCLSLAFSAHSTFAASPAPAAKINGVAITESAVDALLPAAQRNDANARIQALQRLIAQELFWQQAQKAGLAPKGDSSDAAKQIAIQNYIKKALKPQEPSEAELHARYDRIVAQLGPKEFRVSLIETKDEASLKTAQKALESGSAFAQVAQQYSIGATAQKGGELNWVSFPLPASVGKTNGLPLKYAQTISSLENGKVSAPVAIEGRWALIRVDATRPTLVPSFEATRPTLHRALFMQSVQSESVKLTSRLLKQAKVELAPRYQTAAMKP